MKQHTIIYTIFLASSLALAGCNSNAPTSSDSGQAATPTANMAAPSDAMTPPTAGDMAGPPPGVDGPGGAGGMAPPAEAFAACEGLSESESCTVSIGDHSIEGSCGNLPGVEAIVCIPAGGTPAR